MKKVLLFLVDSMMPDVLEQCVAENKAPAFQYMMEHGQYINDCATVFPTMTASIDCSLITGVYPDQHTVPGLVWYEPDTKKIINYINGAMPVAKIGIAHCAQNVLYDLNEKHLSRYVKTIHEVLEEQGFVSGSINVIAHRGHKKHTLQLPLALQAVTGGQMPRKVSGPSIFSMGTMAVPNIFRPIPWGMGHTSLGSYGINDAYAIDVLIEVVTSGKQPDFTLVYLPDNDHKLHRSPMKATEHLAAVDQQIARFLNTFQSWEKALEENVFIFISDHGQTTIGLDDSHNIELEKLLASFRLHKLGEEIKKEDEIVICNNERMTYLYPMYDGLTPKIVAAVTGEPRIDLIAWKENGWVHVQNGGRGHNTLKYRKGGGQSDCYGMQWTIEGDLKVLDLQLDSQGNIFFDSYPDALSRLHGALFARNDEVVIITAAPAYEFYSEYAPTHLGGGSHGSLHKRDSLVPLIVAGAKHVMKRPARLVDVKDFILQELAVQAVPV
ncbi:alkaline phosphatase family protein [Brevibacillus fluminis]|uniref:Alkaline phosphatase family protein n=1 Tax=Brevibacillus fluminis TaxID=511487 RepID=A0A3M8D2G7_9BACL|nr:alkaline phosphatase family protein [Brevibacillus fluminis]RNB82266.1 alkaline phosphatase family protein [Brevibacillus fluminis]